MPLHLPASLLNKDNNAPHWADIIRAEWEKDYMIGLRDFIRREEEAGHEIYPPAEKIFTALELTPLSNVRLVILGQDPYHGAGQAHGLAFSVPQGVRLPPSLRNIYKELQRSLSSPIPSHGNLSHWAQQGVLLLNATLTVRKNEAGSHAGQGWEKFTDSLIKAVNKECNHVVFMLWGSYARKKAAFIDAHRHLILTAVHPSPLSAHRGFIGCDHFRLANEYLQHHNHHPIDWRIE